MTIGTCARLSKSAFSASTSIAAITSTCQSAARARHHRQGLVELADFAGGTGAVEIKPYPAHAAVGVVREHPGRDYFGVEDSDPTPLLTEHVEAFQQERVVGAVKARL